VAAHSHCLGHLSSWCIPTKCSQFVLEDYTVPVGACAGGAIAAPCCGDAGHACHLPVPGVSTGAPWRHSFVQLDWLQKPRCLTLHILSSALVVFTIFFTSTLWTKTSQLIAACMQSVRIGPHAGNLAFEGPHSAAAAMQARRIISTCAWVWLSEGHLLQLADLQRALSLVPCSLPSLMQVRIAWTPDIDFRSTEVPACWFSIRERCPTNEEYWPCRLPELSANCKLVVTRAILGP
jgi:hypothetical protein